MTLLVRQLLMTALLFTLSVPGCVSVNLGNKDVSKASKIRFEEPTVPFESLSLKSADRAWQSQKSGSTLSYFSICNDAADPSLATLRDGTLHGIENLNYEEEKTLNYNGREALKTRATGSLDGVKVQIRLLTFKRNFCNYTISMVGVQGKFGPDDEQAFEKFLAGFSAP